MLNLLSGFHGLLATLCTVLITALGVYLKGRSDGKNAEQTRQSDKDAKARIVTDEIDNAIAGRDAASNRERLRKWGK